jgi:CRP-like cAMP-binding protein
MMKLPLAQEVDQIKGITLFRNLRADDLSWLVQTGRQRHFKNGEFIFYEGDPADTLYVLLKGRVKLTQITPEGQQVLQHYVAPGEAFAIVAVFSESQYPVSAETIDDSITLAWDRDAMRQIMLRYPSVAINALHILAEYTREFMARVREMSSERVERRIARALLRLAQQAGKKVEAGVLIDLPLSRQDLAELAGTTLFTVSRTLSQWEAQGLLKSGREKVIIRFPHGLVSIAEDLPAPGQAPE